MPDVINYYWYYYIIYALRGNQSFYYFRWYSECQPLLFCSLAHSLALYMHSISQYFSSLWKQYELESCQMIIYQSNTLLPQNSPCASIYFNWIIVYVMRTYLKLWYSNVSGNWASINIKRFECWMKHNVTIMRINKTNRCENSEEKPKY